MEGSPRTTVLCVDDDPLVTDFLEALLIRSPTVHVVHTETSVDDAVAWLSDGRAGGDGNDPDCIVSDYHMPTDGLTFLGLVRARLPDTPFVFFTSEDRGTFAASALDSDATAVVRKQPISSQADALVECVEASLR